MKAMKIDSRISAALEIDSKMSTLTKTERKITREILDTINLCIEQKAYLELGFGSPFDWLVKGHGYSEGSAQRRLQAARLLRSAPGIAEKIESGSVNLTTLAKTETYLSAQEKVSREKISSEDRVKLVEKIENQTAREAERSLAMLLPEVAQMLDLEGRDLGNSVSLSDEVFADLERVKDLLSHVVPDGNLSEILGYVLKDFLKRKDPLRKLVKPIESTAVTAKPCVKEDLQNLEPEMGLSAATDRPFSPRLIEKRRQNPASQKVPSSVSRKARRIVFQRAQGKCQYRSPLTGRVCESSYQIQVDHVHPKALGGSDMTENLQCLCGKHNRLRAEKTFGRRF